LTLGLLQQLCFSDVFGPINCHASFTHPLPRCHAAAAQELLAFVETHCGRLDVINLVTCLYRLARVYTSLQHSDLVCSAWKTELLASPAFSLLMRESRCVHGRQAGGCDCLHCWGLHCLARGH
jgi:hypothetical protein